MFFNFQDKELQNKYFELLKIVGSLSNLFAESNVPYLYYRAAENIFCKSFNADNLSRSDCSADARKSNIGIGLKTFLNNNGRTFQKIAEFNKERSKYSSKNEVENLILEVSKLRNKRIESTKVIHGVSDMIYHCVAREENKFIIFEEKMDLVNLEKISNINKKENTIIFEDGTNEYNFNISKSTLLKRFYTPEDSLKIDIDIIKDPFNLLENLFKKYKEELFEAERDNTKSEFVILPLYSYRTGEVEEKSGLNQWNAGGRKRNDDEVYIPVPIWIHKNYPKFFPNVDTSFEIILPNKIRIAAKMCQTQNLEIEGEILNKGKGLMSNPNTDLGKWILRDILKMPYKKVVKKSDLEEIGIDSVEIRKIDEKTFEINFKEIGSFDKFVNETEK